MIDTEALRKKVIDLAIQGKLTQQLPEDGNAEDLYAQIQKEKAKLIKEGKIKKEKPLPEISDDEIPFEIPNNWKWVYMGDIFEHNTGKALNNADKNGVKLEYITTSNMYWDHFELDGLKSMYFKESEIEKCTITKGDLLICEGGDIGRSAIWTFDYDMRIQNHIHKLRGYCGIVHKCYFYIMRNYKDIGMIDGRGIGLQGFSSKRVHSLIVPLPPLAEQKRIVDKLDNILAQIDCIASLQQQYESDREILRGKIIDAGIRGKLTEQLPDDGNAEDLYAQIQEEKAKLIKEGKIKKEKPLPEISDAEIPFDIPNNWKWVRWGSLSNQIQYGYNAPAQSSGRIKMVRITDIQNNMVKWETVPFCEISEDDIPDYLLHINDILFARSGATVGKSYLVESIEEDAVFAGYLIRTNFSNSLSAKYLKRFMESSLYWRQLTNGTTATAQPNCNAQTLSKMMVPLPPLAEQERIAKIIDDVFEAINRAV